MNSANPKSAEPPVEKPHAGNFLRSIIESDLANHTNETRLLGEGQGTTVRVTSVPDPAPIRTRFPPEPNGYLHVGHAKSIVLNFGLAQDFCGVCHMRFDDTNPAKEEQEYVDTIIDTVRWLGFDWKAKPFEERLGNTHEHLYFASDYFERLYGFAEYLIETGYAYVDSQDAETIRANRGTLTEPGRDSPDRDASIAENLAKFRSMRAGDHPDGAMVLRARMDMASPNMNLRDPVLYRIRRAHHHRTGDAWCIYPMYDYTHCISDAIENITHSVCTLEFEDHRPLYDWVLERLVPRLRAQQFGQALDWIGALGEQGLEAKKEFAMRCHNARYKLGASAPERRMRALLDSWDRERSRALTELDEFFELLLATPEMFAPLLTHALDEGKANPFGLPHQYEFARMKLTNVVTSKRKLRQLVEEGHVQGWDDPRLPTLVGMRRRGYTAAALHLMCERVGVAKADTWIDYSVLETAVRDVLDDETPRASAVLNPLKLVIDNFRDDVDLACSAPVHPHHPEMGTRTFTFGPELWIEAEDFTETPPKGYFRLFPGNKVRLRHGFVIECKGCERDAEGNVTAVHADFLPETKSGTPGADSVKVKGNIHWINVNEAIAAEVRLFDRLFTDPHPDVGNKDFLALLNPQAKRVIHAYLEPSVVAPAPQTRFQFERHGYFIVDRDSSVGHTVFNRIVTLKDSWNPKPA